MSFLLDTCVVSELIKKQADKNVMRWIEQQEEHHLFLSVLTIGELVKGISKLDDSPRKRKLSDWINIDICQRFQHRVLPVDSLVSQLWGEILGSSEKAGGKLPIVDTLIAATALVHKLTLVTRNVADMSRCSTAVFNPWTSSHHTTPPDRRAVKARDKVPSSR